MLRICFILGFVIMSLIGCGNQAGTPKFQYEINGNVAKVIYGNDSVKDVSVAEPNAKYTVAILKKELFVAFMKNLKVDTVADKYGELMGINWTKDPSLAICSGVLIGKNRALTAGHCFEGMKDCSDFVVVTGLDSGAILKKDTINAVGCKEIVKRKEALLDNGLDYAVLDLEKDLADSEVKVSSQEPGIKDSIYALGYPLGATQKKAKGQIREVFPELGLYNSNLDVYQGNSGSPVYLAKNHELIGIISTGEGDFEGADDSSPTNLAKIKHCPDEECLGEIIIPIQKILADLNK